MMSITKAFFNAFPSPIISAETFSTLFRVRCTVIILRESLRFHRAGTRIPFSLLSMCMSKPTKTSPKRIILKKAFKG